MPKTVRLSRVVVYMMYRRRLLPHVKSNQSPSAPCGHSQTAFFSELALTSFYFKVSTVVAHEKEALRLSRDLRLRDSSAALSDGRHIGAKTRLKKNEKNVLMTLLFSCSIGALYTVCWFFFKPALSFLPFFSLRAHRSRTSTNFFNSLDRNDDEKNETFFLSQMPRRKKN